MNRNDALSVFIYQFFELGFPDKGRELYVYVLLLTPILTLHHLMFNRNKDDEEKWSSITTRFLGGTSLKSLTSRHAISRLFWPRYILEEKELVKLCFEKQDIAVAVFERQYGMHPEAAKALSLIHISEPTRPY